MNTESDGVNPRPRTWRRSFMPVTGNVPEARHGARRVLAEWVIPEDTSYTIALIISELVTNAVRHARVPGRCFEVALTYDGEKTVEIEVSDASPRHPVAVLNTPDVEATSGRGLPLVEALSDAWEVRDREYGKTVWARVLS
ncbi:ATP-binding protein [Streptomyces sp. NBC_00038]|uniref:ATP-binding protein n=1 Tax=Streptomyces sp. NBC_00038 TaxID=2903615 RepID=UPI002257E9EF|nr:ATP-binding protein [Streptomyces sp. NBC_00038]MCX5557868.1 ATP-binding protein [Streptomyces sp. NBC_00038]